MLDSVLSKVLDEGSILYNIVSICEEKEDVKHLEKRLRLVKKICKETSVERPEAIARLKAQISAKKSSMLSTTLSAARRTFHLAGLHSKTLLETFKLSASAAKLKSSLDSSTASSFSAINVTTTALDTLASVAQAKVAIDAFMESEDEAANFNMKTIALVASSTSTLIKSREQIAKVASKAQIALFESKQKFKAYAAL